MHNKALKEKLIKNVKKEVKQIMEEAVTKKFVHEESASITSLCAAVEACVSHGLKRRALGLFKSSSTTALLHKIAKAFQPAANVVQLIAEVENCDPNNEKLYVCLFLSHTNNITCSNTRLAISSRLSLSLHTNYYRRSSSSGGSESASKLGVKPPLQKRNSVATMKYLWIRLALIEKHLAKIVDYIVANSSKYYEKDALVADPDYGTILSSLLVGPCALDYSKLRTAEHFWTDPPADELVQRHRISSGQFPLPASPPAHKRPGLHYKGSTGFSNSDDNMRSKDYVESLHQNSKSTLLYGKNNVVVYMKDGSEPLAGYLSLHQCGEALLLKWTPNQLMNGCTDTGVHEKSVYWEHALNVAVHETVYVHCHQGPDSDWIALVGQDGVQRPPIHFPRGGHLLAFLSCLENGLLPHGILDPPLWSQRGKGKFTYHGVNQKKTNVSATNLLVDITSKVFPKLKRKGSSRFHSSTSPLAREESTTEDLISEKGASDFVFRIVYPNFTRTYPQVEDMLEYPVWQSSPSTPKSSIPPTTPRSTPLHSVSTTSSTSSSRSLDQQCSVQEPGEPIQVVCQTMKKQIISRAFYGWLAHCRHLRTVRTHLVGLVRSDIVKSECPTDATPGLTEEKWKELQASGSVDMKEIYRLVYFGGMAHSLRKQLWPIMLSGKLEGEDPEALRREYEDKMSEWLAVEAIVRQRDKETMAQNLAKLSSEGGNSSDPQPSPKVLQTHESNEAWRNTSIKGEPKVFVDAEETLSSEPTDGNRSQKLRSVESTTASPLKTSILSEKRAENGDVANIKASNSSNSPREKPREVSFQSDAPVFFDPSPNKHDEDDDSDVSSGEESPVATRGGVYSNEILESFGLNLHRIDKDVKRCDRNHWYFTESNLDKLRNVMCTYVWEHMEMGYVQGMCDLAAPLLVILDDEAIAYGCFRNLMERMSANFPSGGGAMDAHFANMRSLLQVLDHDLFALIRQNGDYTHFYFCYRWFLLDFKREFSYDDVFLVWETIWAARHIASADYGLFLALALLAYYRDIILANSMDFTDIIKFFNEMAERHDAKAILQIARSLVLQLQTLIENK
ncbi:Small G protein signaling modulator 2 [Orchesella cincta]|uniref:Small G protein signaling modulator 2 n=1 Tax=Orchesella cincta TaxID=48709 RepID=A0A1D2NBK5_ORCCI|nr:Small G protein signaling modulator 2 [Orchesella cincta]